MKYLAIVAILLAPAIADAQTVNTAGWFKIDQEAVTNTPTGTTHGGVSVSIHGKDTSWRPYNTGNVALEVIKGEYAASGLDVRASEEAPESHFLQRWFQGNDQSDPVGYISNAGGFAFRSWGIISGNVQNLGQGENYRIMPFIEKDFMLQINNDTTNGTALIVSSSWPDESPLIEGYDNYKYRNFEVKKFGKTIIGRRFDWDAVYNENLQVNTHEDQRSGMRIISQDKTSHLLVKTNNAGVNRIEATRGDLRVKAPGSIVLDSAAVPATAPDGAISIDPANSKLCVRIAGAWKCATLE